MRVDLAVSLGIAAAVALLVGTALSFNVGLIGNRTVIPYPNNSTPPVYDIISKWDNPGVVALVHGSGDSFCSGFVVSDKYVITAGHCVTSLESADRILFNDLTKTTFSVAVESNPKLGMQDYAILKVDGPISPNRILDLACGAEPKLGTPIRLEGFPLDMGYVLMKGFISGPPSPWNLWKFPVWTVGVEAAPGNSGSPVFIQETGEVFAILVGGATKVDSLSVGQPIDIVCEALDLG